MSTETQNPESNTATVDERGSEEAAIAALEQRGKPAEATKPATEPKPDNDEADADEGDTEPLEGEPDETDEPTADLVEVEIEGETLEVSPKVQKAIREGLLRQAEFSRKMNAVGETEKIAKTRLEQADKLVDGAEKYAEVLASVNSIDAQIAQFEKVDWAQLRTGNPAEYAALIADMQSLRSSRDTAVRKAQGIEAEVQGIKQTQAAEKREEMQKILSKDLKGWGDELGTKITKYALEQGYQAGDLHQITDAKWVIAMNKARQFDALQTEKAGLKGKTQEATKFVKPGSPRRVDPTAELATRFRKSASTDDAIALLEARQKR